MPTSVSRVQRQESSTAYYVSTPAWTVRVDVEEGHIQRTSARYLHRDYGTLWADWIARQQRRYGPRLRCVCLGEA